MFIDIRDAVPLQQIYGKLKYSSKYIGYVIVVDVIVDIQILDNK